MATERAEGKPTKKLFIDTLVRDVDLTAAIVDLIDNCIDGAKRIRPTENFSGLGIRVKITPQLFEVADNCGGIPLEMAKHYAFRFGRSDDYEGAVSHSVGHFGVGMKRTLFKLAEKFTVLSITESDGFRLDVDVSKWKEADEWDFDLKDVTRLDHPQKNRVTGTVIQVAHLKPEISTSFSVDNFLAEVRERIRIAHTFALVRGMEITFNDEKLEALELTIKQSSLIKPHVQIGSFDVNSETVKYRMISGVSDQASDDAGWYVFCNGRLLLSGDQSAETGWGESPAQKFHQQFNRFRGYLFLEADNPGLLPWNTTKTGMSEDSDVYRKLKIMMRAAIYEVTKFLNKVRIEEKQLEQGDVSKSPLADAIDDAVDIDVSGPNRFRQATSKFVWPVAAVRTAKGAAEKRITYWVPTDQFLAVKAKLGASTIGAVGLGTFDYYYSMQIEE